MHKELWIFVHVNFLILINFTDILLQMLQSDWPGFCTLSAIQWYEMAQSCHMVSSFISEESLEVLLDNQITCEEKKIDRWAT